MPTSSFEHFKDALLYDKECTITLNKVPTTVRSKEFSKLKDLNIEDNDEGLRVLREEVNIEGCPNERG